MELRNKNILIISQQDWGTMFISKHHYALELAKLGNKVFYISGPDQEKRLQPGTIEIKGTGYDNVFSIQHRLSFPYILKFKARSIYDYLLRSHLKKVLNKIGCNIDLIWSFDLSDTIPLRLFKGSAKKIYMPVDELSKDAGVKAAETADIICSVTQEILDKFKDISVPKVFLNHGVSDVFINNRISDVVNNPIQVGLSGNFLRTDIDWDTIFKIAAENSKVVFNFYGSFDYGSSNLTSVGDASVLKQIDALKKIPNAVLHRQLPYKDLAAALLKMDCFLICYDVIKDQSKGTNYHKILEYLATGKVVISNNVSTYNQYPGMIEMAIGRNNNDELPVLFKNVIENIRDYNSVAKQQQRVAFAKQFVYSNQILKVAEYLN